MAKLIGPLHSAEARGRVSGLIYNTWRGISYAKAFCSPAQPRTSIQLAIRALCIKMVRIWQSLSSDNQSDWNDYATGHQETDWTGNSKRLTGANWFVRLSTRMAFYGLTYCTTPPITVAPEPLAAFAAANGAGSSVVTWTPTAGTDKLCELYHLGPISPGVNAKIERARYKVHLAGETGTVTITPLAKGTHWFWGRVADEDNGLVSTWVRDSCLIT